MSHSLDFSVGKLTFLERRQIDQENLLNSSEREIDELRTSNHQLMEKLEAWSVSISSSPSFMTSINLELELSASDSDLSIYKWYDIILVHLYHKFMLFSYNFNSINEEQEDKEEYDDSTDVNTSELTFVMETEEPHLIEEVFLSTSVRSK